MRAYAAYMLFKQAEDTTTRDRLVQGLAQAKDYLNTHKKEMAQHSANNVVYGLMSNPRGLGSSSVFGASAGGVLDGILMRPVADTALHIADKGLHAFYGIKESQ